jgi:hypothetical protein
MPDLRDFLVFYDSFSAKTLAKAAKEGVPTCLYTCGLRTATRGTGASTALGTLGKLSGAGRCSDQTARRVSFASSASARSATGIASSPGGTLAPCWRVSLPVLARTQVWRVTDRSLSAGYLPTVRSDGHGRASLCAHPPHAQTPSGARHRAGIGPPAASAGASDPCGADGQPEGTCPRTQRPPHSHQLPRPDARRARSDSAGAHHAQTGSG